MLRTAFHSLARSQNAAASSRVVTSAFSAALKEPCIQFVCGEQGHGSWRNEENVFLSPVGHSNLFGVRSLHDDRGRSGEPGQNELLKDVNSILTRIDAAHFQEVLQQEAQTRWNMHYNELAKLCIDSGAAQSSTEAQQICEALDKSGVVLRVKDLIYLRPLEVAEILYKALPDSKNEIEKRLDELKQEAAPLIARKTAIDNKAHRLAKSVLWAGVAVFSAQMIIYARLTFWELSWDVMEPVTYFTGAVFAVMAYVYCLWYNEEFGLLSAHRRIHKRVQSKEYEQKGLDGARLEYLLHRINRLESTLHPMVHPDAGNSQEQPHSHNVATKNPAGLPKVAGTS